MSDLRGNGRATAAVLLIFLAATAANSMGRKPAPKKQEGVMQIANDLVVEGKMSEWSGHGSSEARPAAMIVQHPSDWDRLWRTVMHHAPPSVDFSKHFAVAVFAGSRPTGGYSIEFLEPMTDGRFVLVRYRIRAPKSSAFVIQAFTQPYGAKIYNKTPLPIRVDEIREEGGRK